MKNILFFIANWQIMIIIKWQRITYLINIIHCHLLVFHHYKWPNFEICSTYHVRVNSHTYNMPCIILIKVYNAISYNIQKKYVAYIFHWSLIHLLLIANCTFKLLYMIVTHYQSKTYYGIFLTIWHIHRKHPKWNYNEK